MPDWGFHQQMSEGDQAGLRDLANAVLRPGARFLEVGCWLGQSTAVWAEAAKRCGGTVYAVDHWRGTAGGDHPLADGTVADMADYARQHDIYAAFHSNLCELGLWEFVRPYTMDCAEAAGLFPDGEFDIVFLDAAHGYRAVCRDIRTYYPKVKTGGFLCGHDCEMKVDDSQRAFLEAHKEIDYFNDLHCGVILAVHDCLRDYTIEARSVWAVCKSGDDLRGGA